MTKKLEDLLNLAPADKVEEEKVTEQQDVIPVPDAETYQNAMSKADKIDAALPMVENLEASDGEMDDIADTAKDTFKDLIPPPIGVVKGPFILTTYSFNASIVSSGNHVSFEYTFVDFSPQ